MIPDPAPHVPTSEILNQLLKDASPDHVTLAWLFRNLRERSFGILLVVIALLGLLPGVAYVTGFILFVPAYQMILERPFPVLPSMISSRRLSTRGVAGMIRRITPPLRWLERFARPRWTTPFETTKRAIGAVVMLLALTLLSPIPFSHIIPSLVVMLIAFSFLEKDGVLLAVSLLLAIVSIAITAATVWVTLIAAHFL